MVQESRATRVPLDVYESAKVAASVTSRTVEQQIAHWVRLGRELEMSPQVRTEDIAQVLAGRASYDFLSTDEQSIVRHEWSERIAESTARLNLAYEFGNAGEPYSELDADDAVVIRDPGEHPAT